MKNTILVFLLMAFWGCSTTSPYQRGIDQAFNELGDSQSRSFAQELQKADFDSLSNFSMIVFPKDVGLHRKDGQGTSINTEEFSSLSESEREKFIESKTVFYEPITFDFKVLLKGSCSNLSKTSKYDSKNFFQSANVMANLNCMVLEVRRRPAKFFGKRVLDLERDDIIRKRLYLDEYFRPFGESIDIAVAKGRKPFETKNIQMDTVENLTSGLTFYPTDFPNLKNSSLKLVDDEAPALPQNLFLTFKVKSMKDSPICAKAKAFEHKDILGTTVKSKWCDGSSLPQSLETNRFFAILK